MRTLFVLKVRNYESMGDTPGRMLDLLSLLQTRRSWGGAELAARLHVTERTVRRDVERLRHLGYPVEAVPGRFGGYQLSRGGRLPPLLFNDDEAAAIVIGLRSAIDGSVTGLEESAVSALAKLDQILPAHVAGRVRALHESTASMLWHGPQEQVDAGHLILLAHACSSQERARFDYVDKGGAATSRFIEPLRLVRSGWRWYLVAWDVDRADWRTFRLDRITNPESVGTRFEARSHPDPVEIMTDGAAIGGYPFRARIRLPLSVEEATRVVPRTFAVLEDEGGSTVIELGSTNVERMVGYLAGLNPPCEVLDPPELRLALRSHATAVAAANG
jgi:predicted DNA-binding transcriptional regulator YafY